MNNKGVELSLQTVIIAVLGLLILGVLIYLVVTGVIQWGVGTTCKETDCKPREQCTDGIANNALRCKDSNNICCTPLPTTNG